MGTIHVAVTRLKQWQSLLFSAQDTEVKISQPIENHKKSNTTIEASAKWQIRFDFLDLHDAPNVPGLRQALKKRPFKQKIKVNFNFIAFFFGPVYLVFLGLWKRNITLILIIVVVYTALPIFFR